MPDMNAAALAAHRFGFGPKPGELRVIAGDPRGWVKSQLTPRAPLPPQIAALPSAEDDLLAYGRWLLQRRIDNNRPTMAERQGATPEQIRALTAEQDFAQAFRRRVGIAVSARLEAAVTSDAPVRERLVHFWSNHFSISTLKTPAIALPPSFEKDAIRPNVSGRFADMLLASTKHPGMIVYLDNWLSVGPHSDIVLRPRRGRRFPGGRRPTGINENLAREILELHTLGVSGGYSQGDVQALAAIITGWTYEHAELERLLDDAPGVRSGGDLFAFDPTAHEPGARTLLGRTYGQGGVAQGEAALRDLAQTPACARFIATKLCRHYIADAPPDAAVDRVARAFQQSDGDLHATMEALVDSPEAWATPFAKFKRPEEYAITVLRAVNAQALPPYAGIRALVAMGQRPYAAAGPDGWSDIADAWLTADLVWKRLEFAQVFATRIARADIDPIALGETCLGPLLSEATRSAVRGAESPEQSFAILFASPELQRR